MYQQIDRYEIYTFMCITNKALDFKIGKELLQINKEKSHSYIKMVKILDEAYHKNRQLKDHMKTDSTCLLIRKCKLQP